MREALEQVKQEMGEEALVLDTKRVRSRSFFGKGDQEMIEIRVAANAAEKANDDAEAAPSKKAPRASSSGLTALNLTDDAPAAPAAPAKTASSAAFAALTARAASSAENTNLPAKASPNTTPAAPHRGVELATTPPRIVHAPQIANRSVNTTASPAPSTSSAPAESAQRNTVAAELERLRAELREVKFSINSLAARPAQSEEAGNTNAEGLENDPELYHSPFYEAYRELTLAGLSGEYAHSAIRAAILSGSRDEHEPLEVARFGLCQALPSFVNFASDPLSSSDTPKKYAAVVFIGPTGVGKTTTIAKLAARLALRERRRVELITLDTYRIAAVEQLKTYAEIIGTRCHVARSVMEVDALVRRFAGEATVLVDTVGRNPHDLADQMELADYLRESADLAKCLVLQATTHPIDAAAAINKFALYGANHLAFTKLDETARPMATVAVAAESGLPLSYLCHGQRVPEDIELATADSYSRRVVRAGLNVA